MLLLPRQRWLNMNKHTFKIEHYSISDYLLVSRLLAGDAVSCEDAKVKILSSRATNNATSVRKIIGNFNCIQNVKIPTLDSYFEEYRLNEDYRTQFKQLKLLYEDNPKFVKRLNRKLEKLGKFNEVQGSN